MLGWHADAACAEVSGDLFFPEAGGTAKETQLAKELCGRCLVREECLGYALKHREQYGIWGGTTPQERLALRRAAKK